MTPLHPIYQAARDDQAYVVGLRRALHRAPELSYRERDTAALIQHELDRLGIPWVAVGEFGVVATVTGRHEDAVIVLRADMDALPIQEGNRHLPYCSGVDGVMHACGHDGHVAMLLAAGKQLMQCRDQLDGAVKLCFQQAEEQGGGTAEILAHLAAFPVVGAFAIHLWSEIEIGRISTRAGPCMAACDNFEIVIEGVGCHGANPHRGVDPIVAAASLVGNVSSMMAREIDPAHAAALTFGKLQSGHAGNVIPSQAVLAGSIRTTHLADQLQLHAGLRRVVEHTAATFRASARLDIRRGGAMLVNGAESSALATGCVAELFGPAQVIDFPPLMVSENFGDFLACYPGLMALVGAGNAAVGAAYPHHHPQFNIDEEALPRGVALHVLYATRALAAAGG
ncbi:MAG: yxeP 5 [Rhodoferax sp.]|nr:yxeP 5 [Rhodoferax sp.]